MRNGLLAPALVAAAFVPAAIAAAPTARPPTAVTIAAAPQTLVYGGATTLSGTITPAEAGERVTVLAQACGGTSFTRLADVDTVAGGAWTLAAKPTVNTQYRARVRNVTSNTVSVGVRPRLRLTKVTRRKFKVRVFAAQSFAGKVITFQRFRPATGRWTRVRHATLRQVATGTPTITSGITFRARVRAGTRVRVVLSQARAAPCYQAGRSNSIRT